MYLRSSECADVSIFPICCAKPIKKFHDEIRALIFPPLQFPILDNKEIIKTTFKNNKIYLKFND